MRIILSILALLAGLALSGCVTTETVSTDTVMFIPAKPAATLAAAEKSSGPIVAGTLATPGTYEMVVAPHATRYAVLAERLNRRLKNHSIDSVQAQKVQDATTEANKNLRKAWAIKQPTAEAAAYLDAAMAAMNQADKLLEDAQ